MGVGPTMNVPPVVVGTCKAAAEESTRLKEVAPSLTPVAKKEAPTLNPLFVDYERESHVVAAPSVKKFIPPTKPKGIIIDATIVTAMPTPELEGEHSRFGDETTMLICGRLGGTINGRGGASPSS